MIRVDCEDLSVLGIEFRRGLTGLLKRVLSDLDGGEVI